MRLLTLLPGSPDDLICCCLKEVDLEDDPEYEAISYTWGDAADQKIIDVNSVQVLMRLGLFCFLHQLRDPSEERVVWVDALSTSQTDLDEKARQVAMIARVFKQATCVRAWVGEHGDDSQSLFRGDAASHKPLLSKYRKLALLLRRLRHSMFWLTIVAGLLLGLLVRGLVSNAKGLRVGAPAGSGLLAFYTVMSAVSLMLREPLTQCELAFRIPAWRSFVDRPYWRRTWIVQEIAHARSVIVHCGDDAMGWPDLIDTRIEYDRSESRALTDAQLMTSHPSRPTDREVAFLNVLR